LKQVKGFWLPNGEEHLVQFLNDGPEFAGGPTYQLRKLLPALQYVKNFRHAVDIGAHCGLWARPLAAMFRKVTAFEPVARHRECLEENIVEFGIDNITVQPFALGDEEKEICLKTGASSSGDTFVSPGGEHQAKMRKLDSFGLTQVDFIKCDAEGFEYFIMKGGEKTIRQCNPCIVVEQKPNKGKNFGIDDTAAVSLLTDWGAKLRFQISGDFVLSWQ
jgi:FkbM family methyltransferase